MGIADWLRRGHPEGDPEEDVRRDRPVPVVGPNLLYHYTTTDGLLGIVQEQTLWATDAEFLNDAQELQFGREELRESLLKAADELDPFAAGGAVSAEASRATVMRSAADHLDIGKGPFAGKQHHAAYVACFCESGDLLSQWRGYGSSGGISLGFKTAYLPALYRQEIWEVERDDEPPESERHSLEAVRLVKVKYGTDAIAPLVKQVVQDVAPFPTGHPGVSGFFRAKSVVIPALATIKHESFLEEREWRVIAMGSVGEGVVHFRSSALGPTPFVHLRFPAKALAEIVVGPGRESDLRRDGIERLLAEQRIEGVSVRLSAAPFRG
jgi:DUF2971 family protein